MRLTILVWTYLLKQILQTGSVRMEVATSCSWHREQSVLSIDESAVLAGILGKWCDGWSGVYNGLGYVTNLEHVLQLSHSFGIRICETEVGWASRQILGQR